MTTKMKENRLGRPLRQPIGSTDPQEIFRKVYTKYPALRGLDSLRDFMIVTLIRELTREIQHPFYQK